MQYSRTQKTNGNTIAAEQNRRVKISVMVMFGYLIFILLLSYIVPDDVLARYTMLKNTVDWAGSWIPSIEKFGKVSVVPQVAQLVFTLEVLTLPLLSVMLINKTYLARNLSIFQWLGFMFVVFMLIYGYFIYIPGDGQGYRYSARVMSAMANSKILFALWTSLYTFTLAWFTVAILSHLLGKPRYKSMRKY